MVMPALLSLLLLLPQAADAPLPDFAKPVDYAAWLDGRYGMPKENAADLYDKLGKLFKPSRDASIAAGYKTGAKWSEGERKSVREWVEQNEEALKLFAQAAEMRDCYFRFTHDRPMSLRAATPALGALRTLATCATARARLRLIDGDWQGALDDVLTVLRASQHAQQQPEIRQVMTGRAIASMAYAVLREVPQLAGDKVDYTDLLKRLRREDRGPVSLKTAIELQRVFFLGLLQKDGRDADGDGRIEAFEMPGKSMASLDPPQTPSELLTSCDQVLELMQKMQNARYSERSRMRQGSAMLSGLRPPEVASMLPNLFPIDKERRAHEARAAAARLVLDLHAYHAAHKTWPQSLRDATRDEASSIRKDPYSDEEFVYKLSNGQPLLYSIGADGVDNGGRSDPYDHYGESSDLVFWPPAE